MTKLLAAAMLLLLAAACGGGGSSTGGGNNAGNNNGNNGNNNGNNNGGNGGGGQGAAASIAEAKVFPSVVVYGREATLKVTAAVADAAAAGVTGVDLVQTGTGDVVGRRLDNGQDGDGKAGDGVFTCLWRVTPVSQDQLDARVVLSGGSGTAKQMAVPKVSILDKPLPSDPGEDRDEGSVAGADSDNDGVRDDIQWHIAESHKGTENTAARAALQQVAVAYQEALLNAGDGKSTETASGQLRAAECLYAVLGEKAEEENGALVGMLLNTGARRASSTESDRFFGGKVWSQTPEDRRTDRCDFDPNQIGD